MTSKRFVTPDRHTYEREFAELQDRTEDPNTQQAAYAVLWFMGSGRSFTGLSRVLSHADRRTIKAFLIRVRNGMLEVAKEKRGPSATHIVAGDLSNVVLATALYGDRWRDADNLACNHPYGQPFTLGRV